MSTRTSPPIVEQLYSASRLARATITQRADGLYEVEVERFLEGDPLIDEPSYWPISAPKTLTDSIERARELALENMAGLSGLQP